VSFVLNNLLEIIINIEVKYSVRIALISTGNGKRNLKERKWNMSVINTTRRKTLYRYLQAFQKVRDCSHIHDHDGTTARIQVFEFDFFIY
jgi:hypothetical protein